MRERTQSTVVMELIRASRYWQSISPVWLGRPGTYIEDLPDILIEFSTEGLGSTQWFKAEPTDPPSMYLYVNPGVAYFGSSGSAIAYAGGTSGSFAQPTSGSRIDVLYYNFNTGSLGIQQGSPGTPPTPTYPSGGSCLEICEVWLGQPTSASIFDTSGSATASHFIRRDIRPFLAWGVGTGGGGDGVTDHGQLTGLADNDHLQYDRHNLYSITVENPTGSEDICMGFTFRAITVQEIQAVVKGTSTPSITIDPYHTQDRSSVGNDILSSGSAITNTTTGQNLTSFDDPTIPADSWIVLETTATSGSPTELTVTIRHTEDV